MLRVNLGVQGVESADARRVRADLAAMNTLCGIAAAPAGAKGALNKGTQVRAGCPRDFSHDHLGLHNGGPAPVPWSDAAVTEPGLTMRGSNGDEYYVWGGVADPAQDVPDPSTNAQRDPAGVVIVTREGPDPCAQPRPNEGIPEFYKEPSATGILTITAFDGDIVSYKTAGGRTGQFNVVRATYL